MIKIKIIEKHTNKRLKRYKYTNYYNQSEITFTCVYLDPNESGLVGSKGLCWLAQGGQNCVD